MSNLACAAVDCGFETAILDLDPQASVGRWARVRKKAGLKAKPFAEVCVPIDVEDRLRDPNSWRRGKSLVQVAIPEDAHVELSIIAKRRRMTLSQVVKAALLSRR